MSSKFKRKNFCFINGWSYLKWSLIKFKIYLNFNISRSTFILKYFVQYLIYFFIILSLFEILYFSFTQIYISSEKSISFKDYEKFKLINVDEAESVVLSPCSIPKAIKLENCTFFNCFNVNLCDRNFDVIKVFIYPVKKYLNQDNQLILQDFSEEYWQLLEAVVKSPYFINDPSKACVFIPSLDTLSQNFSQSTQLSQILKSLPFWKNDGQNHLLFNMIPGFFPHHPNLFVNTDKAIIAGGNFDSWSFRPNFDISIPVYSPHSHDYNQVPQLLTDKNREWLIVSPQEDLIDQNARAILQNLENKHKKELLLLQVNCNKNSQASSLQLRCNKRRELFSSYLKILEQSKFCLLMKTKDLNLALLSDSLMTGCIPIIVIDELILPFESKIDWAMISIRIREHLLDQLIFLVKSIPDEKINEMRQQGMYIWKIYFSSMKSIVLSTLNLLNEKIFPHSFTSKFDWNNFQRLYQIKPFSLINPKLSSQGSQGSQGFTAVIPTYDRVKSLFRIIHKLAQVESCVKILVIWNNKNKPLPLFKDWPNIDVPIKILKTKENSLNNRFYPFIDIETEAVLAIDDDIVMLTSDELEFGFQVWREFPDRIVGFPSSVHRWDNKTDQWQYYSEWTNDVSMVSTRAAFYHNFYNYLYTFEMPKKIRKLVDSTKNCEDIAMNFLVSNVTNKSPIKVTSKKKFVCLECSQGQEISQNIVQHLFHRTYCVNQFSKIYGSMPLKAVNFRADPVLFKDNLPEKLKKFHHVGNF